MATVRDAKMLGIDELFLIGPIGSTKTFAMAMTHINIAQQFDNCIIPVGRKDLSEAQIGTWEVYLDALSKMNYRHGTHYTTRQAMNDLRIRFNKTGSIIQFIGMNRSRDPDWAKLKITATCAGVDEVDDVDQTGYEFLQSRTGRRNDTGAPSITISCCNPNDKWTKQKIYLPWLKRENRRLDNMSQEEWDAIEPLAANKMVIEFTMEDSPLFLTGYYDRFADRSPAWKQRFLMNNWNYIDDENALFKQRAMDTLTIYRLKRGERYIGVDPNAGGKDRAAIGVWEDDTFVDVDVYTTEQLEKLAMEDERHPMNYGAILGRLTVEKMKKEGIGALNVAGDVVGIGQGWLTYMLSHGYAVMQFKAGASPLQTPAEIERKVKPPYADLRSQMYAKWAMDIDNARVFFYGNMPHLSKLKKELQLHEGNSSDKVMKVTPKDEIRNLLGASPDIADCAMMGYWIRYIRTLSPYSKTERASVGRSVDELYNSTSAF